MMFPASIFVEYKRRIFLAIIVRISTEGYSKRQIYLSFTIDKEPRAYRAIYDSKESPEEVRQFRKNKNGHLKLLYYIDMLNEGTI